MVTPLFKQGLRNIAPLFGAVVAVLLVYIGTVVYLYDPSVSESLALMQEAMPELFAAFGMANPSATLLDFLLNYLYGFLLTATFVPLWPSGMWWAPPKMGRWPGRWQHPIAGPRWRLHLLWLRLWPWWRSRRF